MTAALAKTPPGLWHRLGNLPRRGWSLLEVVDLERPEHECDACGYPTVRYVHHLGHLSADRGIAVGCVCAEYLTGDYTGPRAAERHLRNRMARLKRLLDPERWKTTRNGNKVIRYRGVRLVLYPSRFAHGFRINVGDRLGRIDHASPYSAIRAAFRFLDPPTATTL